MAQLRGTPASSAPAKLFDTNREAWVTADDVARLRGLMDKCERSHDWRDRQGLAAFCHDAWDWRGSFDDLLDAWAESRRLEATHAWRSTVSHEVRLAHTFPPYTDARFTGL